MIVAHRNSYVRDAFNTTLQGQKCVCCSSFDDLMSKVQGPVEVNMFSEYLEVIGLSGRIRHISKIQTSWLVTEVAGALRIT